MIFKKPEEYMDPHSFYPETQLPKYKIMVWKNVITDKWECLIRDGETCDWLLAPSFKTKEEAITYASSILKQRGLKFEVVEL